MREKWSVVTLDRDSCGAQKMHWNILLVTSVARVALECFAALDIASAPGLLACALTKHLPGAWETQAAKHYGIYAAYSWPVWSARGLEDCAEVCDYIQDQEFSEEVRYEPVSTK